MTSPDYLNVFGQATARECLVEIQARLRNERAQVVVGFDAGEGRGALQVSGGPGPEHPDHLRMLLLAELVLALELGRWRDGDGACGTIIFDGLAPRIVGRDRLGECDLDQYFEIEDLDHPDCADVLDGLFLNGASRSGVSVSDSRIQLPRG